MANFSEIKTTLDEISSRITSNRNKVAQAEQMLSQALSDLTNMTTLYATFVSEIDDAVTANPENTAYLNAKSEKDLLVAEFQALKTTVESKNTAIENA